MSAYKQLIVTDGLVPVGGAHALDFALNPALYPWQQQLCRCSQTWFESRSRMPIEWYASLTGNKMDSLLTSSFGAESLHGFLQFWIASPFHAMLGRDQLRVMPDALFPWSQRDVDCLCDLLNPLLAEEDMKLIHHQSSLLLLCRKPMDVAPLSFAGISGHTLPNRHPDGRDGGRLMRLLAEIQMLLKQHPFEHRREAGEADVDGLWLWGGSEITEAIDSTPSLPVATRNPLLRSIVDGKDAEIAISEADRLSELFQQGEPLPGHVILAGGERVVWLRRSIWPKFGKPSWKSKGVKPESRLFARVKLK